MSLGVIDDDIQSPNEERFYCHGEDLPNIHRHTYVASPVMQFSSANDLERFLASHDEFNSMIINRQDHVHPAALRKSGDELEAAASCFN